MAVVEVAAMSNITDKRVSSARLASSVTSNPLQSGSLRFAEFRRHENGSDQHPAYSTGGPLVRRDSIAAAESRMAGHVADYSEHPGNDDRGPNCP
jgi:hypothetical protein